MSELNTENASLASFEKDLGFIPGELERIIERQRSVGWADLKPDQRAFAIAYTKSLSHITAARDIKKPGHGLMYLHNPLVRALIEDLQKDQHQTNIISENFVRMKWLELLPKLMGEETVSIVGKFGTYKGKKFHASETVSVLKELSKSTKFYEGGSSPEANALDSFAAVLSEALTR